MGLPWSEHFTLIFRLCNKKQWNFRHFNTNSEHLTVTVIFPEADKHCSRRPIWFCLVYPRQKFSTIPDYFSRFPKTAEDIRRLPKIADCYAPLNTGSKFMSCLITDFPRPDKNWQHLTIVFLTKQRPSKYLKVFSAEAVNIT